MERILKNTANGAVRRFQRRGRKDDGEYGKIDNLNIRLDGNLNNPRTVRSDNGSSLTYDYLPDGTLMSKTYDIYFDITGKSRVISNDGNQGISTVDTVSMVPTDSLPDISGYGTTERIAYSGNTVYRNGKLYKVLFPGGYCTFENGSDSPTFHYFTQDHLGNNRVVTNEDGTVEQITHYNPFGGPFGDAGMNPELQPYKYNGKELDRMFGLDTYDYGARQYFPALPVWDRMDPLCEQYYNASPYCYCSNNPVLFIDEDGRKIELATGSTTEFKNLFMQAIAFLASHYCDNLYQLLENSEHVFILKETNGIYGDSFSYENSTIEWNPMRGLYTGFTTLSPIVLLNHEFDHAVEWLKSPTDFIEKIMILPDDDIDTDYHTKDDKRVIDGSERDTAYKLGEIERGGITRNGHYGVPVTTVSPTSQITFDEVPGATVYINNDDEKRKD